MRMSGGRIGESAYRYLQIVLEGIPSANISLAFTGRFRCSRFVFDLLLELVTTSLAEQVAHSALVDFILHTCRYVLLCGRNVLT